MLKLRSYDLPDLSELVKKIWFHSDQWRLYEGKIEFSLPISNNEKEWFPLYQSPEHIEKFVRSWYRSGGLNNLERIDVDFETEYYLTIRDANEEILKMRKELFNQYESTLLKEYCEEDVKRSLIYFLAAPNGQYRNQSTINVMLDCCKVAKTYREDRNQR